MIITTTGNDIWFHKKHFLILIIIVLLIVLGFICLFSYHYGLKWLDSDLSSGMVRSRFMAEENSLISTNWLYATELHLVHHTTLKIPLFKLLGSLENWALIRSVCIFLMNIILILSYLFMMKQLNIRLKWILITSIFLLLPMSHDYWNLVNFGGNYLFYIVQLFCCIGIYIKLINLDSHKNKFVFLILFCILSFILGVQGIRSLLIINIPLFLTSFYIWIKKDKKLYPLSLGCINLFLAGIGFIFNKILQNWYSFKSYNDMLIENLYGNFLSQLSRCLINITGFFGFTPGVPVFSIKGIFSISAFIAAFLIIYIVYRALKNIKLCNEHHFLILFFAVSVIFNIFVLIIIEQPVIGRYFIPFMVLYIPLTAVLFEYSERNFNCLKRTAIICGIILFIFGQSYLNFQNLTRMDLNSIRKDYIQYLLDENLEFGFATFWNANITTELSNDRINITNLEPSIRHSSRKPFSIGKWLIPKKYLNPDYHKGESFLLLTREEWEQVRRRSLTGVTPDFIDDNFIIIRYPSAAIIHRDLLE